MSDCNDGSEYLQSQGGKFCARTGGRAIALWRTFAGNSVTKIIAEDVATQKWLIQEIQKAGIPVEGFKVSSLDKRARLTNASAPVQAGQVFFPRHGAEDLIRQLLGFGVEKHDDLADAFSMVVMEITTGRINRISFCQVDGAELNMPEHKPLTPEEENKKRRKELEDEEKKDSMTKWRQGFKAMERLTGWIFLLIKRLEK